MYGLVNRALKEFVEAEAGKAMWRTLCAEVGFAEGTFQDLDPYPDALTYELVSAASRHLKTPAEDVLSGFGRHWVLLTGRSRYADVFDAAGEDLESFVHGLQGLHAFVGDSMPELRPPSFGAEETDSGLLVYYASDREGLEPMVVGLIEGLAEHFGVKAEVRHLEESPHGEAVFSVEVMSV